MDTAALVLSLRLAALTTAVLLVVGLPLAWWLATTPWRGRFLVEALVALPVVLPPTVLDRSGLAPRRQGRRVRVPVRHPLHEGLHGLVQRVEDDRRVEPHEEEETRDHVVPVGPHVA